MSLLTNQVQISPGKNIYSGGYTTIFNNSTPGTLPLVNIAGNATDQIAVFDSVLYPNTGTAYRLTVNYDYLVNVASVPSPTQVVSVILQYRDDASPTPNVYSIAKNSQVLQLENQEMPGSLTLDFIAKEDILLTYFVELVIDNLTTEQLVGANSSFQITSVSCVEITSAPKLVTDIALIL